MKKCQYLNNWMGKKESNNYKKINFQALYCLLNYEKNNTNKQKIYQL